VSNNFKLGIRSLQNLSGVHPDLVSVVKRAIQITEVDFTVIEGLRSRERQKQLVAKGASKTMNSRHITGHAVDMIPWPVDWNDLKRFEIMAEAMKQAADELGVDVEWGGDWRTFYDGPHFQLSRKAYP
jgi:peptidoglycan L-alanyl-D-glutamate endopeptidase CwlK